MPSFRKGDEVEIERYTSEHAVEWDQFVADARNSTFLFFRDYMGYHSNRIRDHSLLFRSRGKLIAILPASERGGALVSHGGLTYGGVVSNRRMSASMMLELFDALREYAREAGLGRIVYKPVPHIYHRVPAEEDLYALFRNGARLVRRDVSATIRLKERLAVSKGRRSSVNVARRNAVAVERSLDFQEFMRIEAEVLAERHGTSPVHTGDEMAMLAGRFPENIRLFAARHEGEMLGGVLVYVTDTVAHAQYIGATERGRDLCAIDLVLDYLLNEEYAGKRYFDFGISTEDAGMILNAGLAAYKESYGARGTVYDLYELDVTA